MQSIESELEELGSGMMQDSKFIGRGEVRAKVIFSRLFNHQKIATQVPIESLISYQDFVFLDQEFKNHKFDIVVYRPNDVLVIEINYKHGNKAAQKWNDVFKPLLLKNACVPITIDDYDCEKFFKGEEPRDVTWDDVLDIVQLLKLKKITF